MGSVVYKFNSLTEQFEQRFSTLKLAMRKAYLDCVYKRFHPNGIIDLRDKGKVYDIGAMKSYWEQQGW
jgi:hypothetical protein